MPSGAVQPYQLQARRARIREAKILHERDESTVRRARARRADGARAGVESGHAEEPPVGVRNGNRAAVMTRQLDLPVRLALPSKKSVVQIGAHRCKLTHRRAGMVACRFGPRNLLG